MKTMTNRRKSPELPSEEVAGEEAFRRLERIEHTARSILPKQTGGRQQGRSIDQNGLNLEIECPEIMGYEKDNGMRNGDRLYVEVERDIRAGTGPPDNIKHRIEFVRKGNEFTFKLFVDNVPLWESDAFLHPGTQAEVLDILQHIAEALETKQIVYIRAAIDSEKEEQSSNIATVLAAGQSMKASTQQAALEEAQAAIGKE